MASMKNLFNDAIKKFNDKAKARTQAAFLNSGAHMHRSITVGSPVTGAPGQAVQDVGGGTLLNSWQLTISKTRIKSSTDSPYAQSNEDGIARPGGGPYIQRSAIGGRHSVQKTTDALDLIVEHEVDLIRRGDD